MPNPTGAIETERSAPSFSTKKGNNAQLIYQKSGNDSASINIYDFRENGEYATTMRKTAAKHFSDADLELNIVYKDVIGKPKPANVNALRQFKRKCANDRDDTGFAGANGHLDDNGNKYTRDAYATAIQLVANIALQARFPNPFG